MPLGETITCAPRMTPEEIKAKQELDLKPFKELTADQKIDRLVEHVVAQTQGNDYLLRRVSKLERQIRMLKKHTHASNGGVPLLDLEVADNDQYGGDSLMRKMPSIM